MVAKVVAIGDSLTQGFLSGSISKSHLSYPALIAECLGDKDFKTPNFAGAGGLPLNIEALLHRLAKRYGSRLDWLEAVPAALTVRSFMDNAEDYWERGDGSQRSSSGPLHHNLAVWGFQFGDSDTLSEAVCRSHIAPPRDQPLQQIPESSQYRTARRTLNPSFSPQYQSLTQIGVAQQIAQTEGIDNLIYWMGGNHCLGTVARLNIKESTETELDKLAHERQANLWRPQDFKRILQRVADKIDRIGAKNVFIANVPHVTIPPISRGVTPGAAPGKGQDTNGYFEYYTHFWIWDSHFNPDRHPHLTKADIRKIDAVVDNYNQLLHNEAQKRGWHLVDIATVLDRLAFRRQQGKATYPFPPDLVAALKANPKTKDRVLADGTVLLDTRYPRIDQHKNDPRSQYKGGLFSLDGIHPSTIGYGLVAHEFLKVMQQVWSAQGESMNLKPLDWPQIVAADSLAMESPPNLANLRDTLGFLCGQTPLPQLIELIGGLSI